MNDFQMYEQGRLESKLKNKFRGALHEWLYCDAHDECSAKTIVGLFLDIMDAMRVDSDDLLELLEFKEHQYAKKPYIKEVLEYEILAIKVNHGY